ncbi:M14 family zinc carboxypeptidase [Reichenbachiella agariperforans]|uniref:M14 family zinc carboxypeptidase n=1 Tax=Reichenbachiella agariperforans TaxID=156994 RepID=UPI001C09FE25|nr:M14 family zinc carboxypeptidase [Reichenbachiella agariperforans]MBU2914204.1 peptidase M14 [Reichenbachiella agariperforans]
MIKRFYLVLFFLPTLAMSQPTFDKLYEGYEDYREPTLTHLRFKHADIQPLIEQYKEIKGFEVSVLGHSIDGRSVSMISVGTGDTDILLWSQMHGDESTATMAIFDMLNFLSDKKSFKKEKKELLKQVRLHFVPMLNPDGAEVFQRRNALDIDINRDALRLQTSEGQILKAVRDSLDAEFGFNLHDQSRYYNAERTAKPATISYLAPAYNYDKDINDVRANAMKVIVLMNDIIQKYVPGQVGRYSDDFEPRAFGDNIQKWGTSAILIESGGQYNDPDKQEIRKLNYMSILAAIFSIADESYARVSIDRYEEIPQNDRKLFDLKIENLTYVRNGKPYQMDAGIHHYQIDNEAHDDYHFVGKISEVGDLSTYYGFETLDATGLTYREAGVVDGSSDSLAISTDELLGYLREGKAWIKTDSISAETKYSEWSINLTTTADMDKLKADLKLRSGATFLLMEDEKVRYVVLNGFLYDVKSNQLKIKNGVIVR